MKQRKKKLKDVFISIKLPSLNSLLTNEDVDEDEPEGGNL